MSGWTAADSAELDVLVWTLVNGYFDHREKCRACQPDPPAGTPYPCPHVGTAIQAVVDWRDLRAMRSKAEMLRAELDGLDLLWDAA